MKKTFKSAAALVMTAAMFASVVPASFAAEGNAFNRESLQAAIKRNAEAKGIAYTYDSETLSGIANVTLDADTDVRVAGSTADYGDRYISSVAERGSAVSLTGDFKSTLDMGPVRKAFEAYKASAEEEVKEGSALGLLLPTVPVKGSFTIDVIYDENMVVGNKDAFLKVGEMYGFNDTAKEVFVDTARRDDADPDHPGYRKLSIDVKVKAPTTEELQGIAHTGTWKDTLVYADLDKSYETLLADIDFVVPEITVSKDSMDATTYYTESISMTGSITIGNALSTIAFDTKQADGGKNNYVGAKDWEKISATMALLLKTSGGGGGGSHASVSTPVPVKPSIAPLGTPTPRPDGSTPEPGTTATPVPTDTPEGTVNPNYTPVPGEVPTPDPNMPNIPTPKPFEPTNNTVPSALNGEDHMVYVIGYPEGDVRPLRSISREEVATIFYRLLTTEKRDSIYTKESSFTDVLKSRWSNKAIATMANGGYILGDAGTTNFRPADAITRAEMAAIVSRFLDTTPDIADSSNDFNDLNGHWAATAVKQGVAAGWLTGYEDNSFKPDQLITRAEAMTVINRMLVRYVNGEGLCEGYVEWPDNPKDAWYYYNVIEATNSHEYNDRTFATAADYYEKWPNLITNWIWGDFKAAYEDPDEIDKQ